MRFIDGLINFIVSKSKSMNPGSNSNSNEWLSCNPQVFWGEIAPFEHIVQVYENKNIFFDLLEGYVLDGFRVGDCVIIIASDEHLKTLKSRLKKHGCNLDAYIADDQLIAVNVGSALTKFMRNGLPDSNLFNDFVNELLAKARGRSRNVRAYGELVSVLIAQGLRGGIVELEHLWRRFCEAESLCLFCAYPKKGFIQNIDDSIDYIYCTHSKVISGTHPSQLEIFYKTTDNNIKPD